MALTNKTDIQVGGITINPQSLKVNWESLTSDDSGRDDSGAMHITFLYSRIRKLEITLKPDTPSNLSTVLNAVLGKTNLSVTYFDPATNTERTGTFYCSSGSGDWYSGVVMNGLVQNVSFNLIEMTGEA